MLLVHTLQGVDGRVEEGPGRGRITVIGPVADPPGVWQREVGANGRDPVGAATWVYVKKKSKSFFSFRFSCTQIIDVQNLSGSSWSPPFSPPHTLIGKLFPNGLGFCRAQLSLSGPPNE